MLTAENSTPRLRAGFYTWSLQADHTRVVFVGKGPEPQRREAFDKVIDRPDLQLCWPHQIHSAVIAEARQPGLGGKADALATANRRLALSVATADCLPIVMGGQRRLAVIHAGWRGLAGQIIQEALEDSGEPPDELEAWIGPAIGACCYEVGGDVASRVVAVSDPSVLIDRQPKPHLDLAAAARCQLRRAGVERVHTLSVCTRCSPDWLWSYRRDGDRAGRNWTFAWRD